MGKGIVYLSILYICSFWLTIYSYAWQSSSSTLAPTSTFFSCDDGLWDTLSAFNNPATVAMFPTVDPLDSNFALWKSFVLNSPLSDDIPCNFRKRCTSKHSLDGIPNRASPSSFPNDMSVFKSLSRCSYIFLYGLIHALRFLFLSISVCLLLIFSSPCQIFIP